jgi:arginine utilization protein RocB
MIENNNMSPEPKSVANNIVKYKRKSDTKGLLEDNKSKSLKDVIRHNAQKVSSYTGKFNSQIAKAFDSRSDKPEIESYQRLLNNVRKHQDLDFQAKSVSFILEIKNKIASGILNESLTVTKKNNLDYYKDIEKNSIEASIDGLDGTLHYEINKSGKSKKTKSFIFNAKDRLDKYQLDINYVNGIFLFHELKINNKSFKTL